jgi:hypothetical protein
MTFNINEELDKKLEENENREKQAFNVLMVAYIRQYDDDGEEIGESVDLTKNAFWLTLYGHSFGDALNEVDISDVVEKADKLWERKNWDICAAYDLAKNDGCYFSVTH